MARRKRNAKGRFIKAASHRRVRRASAKRRVYRHRAAPVRRRRRTARATISLTNPRHSYRRSPTRYHRRRARHNPDFAASLGFNQPTLKAVGFTVLGLAGTPFLESFIIPWLPISISQNQFGKYAIKFGAAFGLSYGVGMVAGKEAKRAVFVGGAAYIVVSAIRDFFPTLLGTGTATPAAGLYDRSMGSQPLLGEYPGRGMGSPMTENIPDRMNPSGRF